MDLWQAVQELSIDLDCVLARFNGNQGLYLRFLNKFSQDKTFAALDQAVNQRDYAGVEQAAHTLKGLAANLGLDALSDASDHLVIAMRQGNHSALSDLFLDLKNNYRKAIQIIDRLNS